MSPNFSPCIANHPTSQTRFHKRIGDAVSEFWLAETVEAGLKIRTVEEDDLETVVVDTTAMEKAVAHPMDSWLYYATCERRTNLARRHGVTLRMSCVLKAKAVLEAVRYGDTRQFRRLRCEARRLKTWRGRVTRDIERRIVAAPQLQGAFAEELAPAHWQLRQQRHGITSVRRYELETAQRDRAVRRAQEGSRTSWAQSPKRPDWRCDQCTAGWCSTKSADDLEGAKVSFYLVDSVASTQKKAPSSTFADGCLDNGLNLNKLLSFQKGRTQLQRTIWQAPVAVVEISIDLARINQVKVL